MISSKDSEHTFKISTHEEKNQKPTLTPCDLWHLRWPYLKNRRHSVMNLRMWSQKHLRKPQSVNTGRRWHKTLPCKAKIKHQQHPEAPPTSVGPSSSQMDWPKVEKCAVVWRVIIQFFGEIMCVKRRKTIQILFSSKFRSIICEGGGVLYCPWHHG